MKTFFPDYMFKKYSFNQKILYIFEQLVIELNPKVIEKYKIQWYDSNSETFKSFDAVRCTVTLTKTNPYFLKTPFGKINISKDSIIIKGNDFYYKFHPENLLLIKKQFKRIKNK